MDSLIFFKPLVSRMLRTIAKEIIQLLLGRTDVNASKTYVNLPNAINHFLNGILINILINTNQ